MKKILTKAISLICVLMLLAAFAPSALAYTEEVTVINWADKTVYTGVSGSCKYDVKKKTNTMDALFGGAASSLAASGYNVELEYPITYDAENDKTGIGTVPLSKFLVDLGAERRIDYIDIYQYKNRIKTIKVYEVTDASKFNAAKNTATSISDSFMAGSHMKLLGEATFDNGESVQTILNELGNCNTPDRITFSETKTARYLFFAITEAVTESGVNVSKILLQKITVNQIGKIGVTVVNNWADANVYTGVKGHNPYDGKGDEGTEMLAALGKKGAQGEDPQYNMRLKPITAAPGEENLMSKFAINLGETRKIDYIDIYQWSNRIKTLKVYKLNSEGDYNALKASANAYASQNFFNNNKPVLLWEGSFDHGTDASLVINPINECKTPDRIEFETPVEAQYLMFLVTDVVNNVNYSATMIQKITVNSETDKLDANALELNINLFQNSGSTKNIGVFAAQKKGEMLVKCDLIRTDVANLTQVDLLAQKLTVDSDATSIDFIILDMATLEPLFKVPYTIEKI